MNSISKAKHNYDLTIVLNGPKYLICMKNFEEFKEDLKDKMSSLNKYADCEVKCINIFGDQYYSDDKRTHTEDVELDIEIKCKQRD